MMTLEDTIELMTSDDYKDRFKAEYHQTRIRHDRLCKMLKQYKEGTLSFTPDCPIEMLENQCDAMFTYICRLLDRAAVEGIALSD